MKPALVVVAALVLFAAGCGGSGRATKTVTVVEPPKPAEKTSTVTVTVPPEAGGPKPAYLAAPAESGQFGYIKSLRREGASYKLRFDPAWILAGSTANAAAAEDGAVEPGEPVPNDYYVVDEGHRLLTYSVAANAHVAVLVGGVEETPITVAQLAQIVAGDDPLHGQLFEPIDTGFWIEVHVDTVSSLRQRYVP